MKMTAIVALAFLTQLALSQNTDGFSCGTPESTSTPIPESEKNFCFDVDVVFDNCTKVWLKMNLHFFLNNQCEGTLDPLGNENIPAEEVYEVAEDMINRANLALEENYEQWNQSNMWGITQVKPAQCVPFRYVLSGVYLHCDNNALNTSGTNPNWFNTNFGVNIGSEYNIFFIEWVGNANGEANGIPGDAFTTENFKTSVFNHEMGHVLSLFHSWNTGFGFDNLADTPPINFQYDYNCDGNITDNWTNGVGRENDDHQCWIDFSQAPLAARSLDYDGDGNTDYQDICNIVENPNCADYPCCEWIFMNNNIMSYTGYTECCAAFTEDQLLRSLDNLSTITYCDYIEDITSDCPPPMANIGVLPFEDTEDDCGYCFYLSASMHDDYHLLEFFDNNGLFHSTGLQNKPAGKYCITKSPKNLSVYNNGFQAGQEYVVRLTVENYCGDESVEEYRFVLPNLSCTADPEYPIIPLGATPNPFANVVTIDYELLETGDLNIELVNIIDPSKKVQVITQQNVNPGIYQQTISTGLLPPGVYGLIFYFNQEVNSLTMIKN